LQGSSLAGRWLTVVTAERFRFSTSTMDSKLILSVISSRFSYQLLPFSYQFL
jgi:hypothetical protein